MSDPTNLSDMYVEELQDLWSANDQMKRVVKELADAASDAQLAERLRKSVDGIQAHTDQLKALLDEAGGEMSKEHCKGMEGLVKEARKHALEEDLEGPVRDVAIIAQYQRMCHYGLAGFGTAKAFADALGKREHAQRLETMLEHIYESDDYMSDLAERSKNLEAAAA
jgi:ferritin-like metal-binding protein YciE